MSEGQFLFPHLFMYRMGQAILKVAGGKKPWGFCLTQPQRQPTEQAQAALFTMKASTGCIMKTLCRCREERIVGPFTDWNMSGVQCVNISRPRAVQNGQPGTTLPGTMELPSDRSAAFSRWSTLRCAMVLSTSTPAHSHHNAPPTCHQPLGAYQFVLFHTIQANMHLPEFYLGLPTDSITTKLPDFGVKEKAQEVKFQSKKGLGLTPMLSALKTNTLLQKRKHMKTLKLQVVNIFFRKERKTGSHLLLGLKSTKLCSFAGMGRLDRRRKMLSNGQWQQGFQKDPLLSGCFRNKETEIPVRSDLNMATVVRSPVYVASGQAAPCWLTRKPWPLPRGSPAALPCVLASSCGRKPLNLLQTSEEQKAVVYYCSSCSKVETPFSEISRTLVYQSPSQSEPYTPCWSSTCRQVGHLHPVKSQPEVGGRCELTNINQICSA